MMTESPRLMYIRHHRRNDDQTRMMLNILSNRDFVVRTSLLQAIGMSSMPFEELALSLKEAGVIEEIKMDRKDHYRKGSKTRKLLAAANANTRRVFRITNKGKRCLKLMNEAEVMLTTK